MNKISFYCICAASAVNTYPTFNTVIVPALKLGISRAEAEHLYDCCCAIYHNSRAARMNR